MSSKGSGVRSLFSDLNVGTKIGLLLLAMVIVAAVNVALVYQATQANEQATNAVDVAGSNRMLTQKAGFAAFMVKDGHPDQEIVKSSLDQMEANLNALDNGGTVGDASVEPVPSQARDELENVKTEWTDFKAAGEAILNEDPYSAEFQSALTYLNENNNDLLKESNDVVVAYTQLPNSGQYADEINVAGRQRMLSQRMVKHAMAISSMSLQEGTEARAMLEQQDREAIQVHRERLAADIQEYDSALNALENGGTHEGMTLQPAPPSVKTEIDDVAGMWPSFKQNAQVVQSTHRLNPDFWSSLAYIEENVDGFVSANNELTTTLTQISTQRSQSLRQMLIGLLGVDIIVFLAGVVLVRRTVSSPLKYMTTEAERIAEQDLRDREIRGADRGDEIGGLSTSFRDMLSNLRRIMTSIKGDSATVASSAEELAAANEETNAASEEIASMVQNINDAAQNQAERANDASLKLQDLSDRSDRIAENAETAEEISSEAREKAERGGEAAEEAMETMDDIREAASESAEDVKDLGEKSEEIGQIVDMITEIAEQTNLLALNAAIEAARAGEQGKGFAVVAEEIRSLAEESTEAAEQISDLITDIRDQTDSAVQSMEEGTTRVRKGTEVVEEALSALQEITTAVEETSEKVKDISGAAQEQTDMVEDAVSSIDEISRMAQETADNTEDVSAATEEQTASLQQVSTSAEELSDIAENLQAVVDEFRLEDE